MKDVTSASDNRVGFSNTQRDFYQSNGAGLVSARERILAEPNAAKAGWSSIQTAGGTFFHKPMMEGRDPWSEVRELSQYYEGIERSMLLRGDVLTAYDIMPDDVIEHCVREHAKAGVNVFTVFDGLNDPNNTRTPIEWVNRIREDEGMEAWAQGVICVGQSPAYTMDLYRKTAEAHVTSGVRDLYIKDPCGVVLPETIFELVEHLKRDFPDQPVYLHTHDTHGLAVAAYLAGIEAGADNVDVCHPAAAGNVAQPSAFRVLHAIETHPSETVRTRAPILNQEAIMADMDGLLKTRMRLREFEPEFDRDVYEALYAALGPGGAASTLKPIMGPNYEQVKGMDWRTAQIAIYGMQASMLEALGHPLQVTPHAKGTSETAGASYFNDAAPTDPSTWTLSKGTRKLLTGQSGNHPGHPDPSLVARALEAEGMSEVMTGRPADRLSPMMETARDLMREEAKKIEKGLSEIHVSWLSATKPELAEIRLARALRNPTMADLVTVAMWNNEKREGLEFVKAKLAGKLKGGTVLPLPDYNVTQKAIIATIGGEQEIERVAQAVIEVEKIGYYRTGYEDVADLTAAQKDRHEHMSRVYDDVAEEAKAIIDDFSEQARQSLRQAKYSGRRLVCALNTLTELVAQNAKGKGAGDEALQALKDSMNDIDSQPEIVVVLEQ